MSVLAAVTALGLVALYIWHWSTLDPKERISPAGVTVMVFMWTIVIVAVYDVERGDYVRAAVLWAIALGASLAPVLIEQRRLRQDRMQRLADEGRAILKREREPWES